MTRFRFAALALGLVLLGGLAGQERTTPRPKGPADLTPVAELPSGKIIERRDLGEQTTLARLGNGMSVIVREHHVAPLATVRVYVGNTGSVYEGRFLGAGISHLTEHLVSGGTTANRTAKEVEEQLDRLGAASNAYTSTDVTAYHIDVPAKQTNVALTILADAVQNCTFPEAEFNREYHVVQRELEMGEAERGRVMYHLLSQLAYREHPLRHPVVGYKPVLQALKREDVVAYYKERYRPQNMTTVIVGDVKTEEQLEAVSKAFTTFRRTAELTIPIPPEPPVASPRAARKEMEGELTDVSLAWPTVDLSHPDLHALDVAAAILGSGDGSRLARKLRFKEKVALTVDATSNTPAGAPGWFGVSLSCEPKRVARATELALAEAYALRDAPVTEAELAKVKKLIAASYVFGHQSVDQIAESLASSYRGTGDPLFDVHYVARIRTVTAADVQRVARTYLHPERLLTATIDPLGTQKNAAATAAKTATDAMQKHVLPNGVRVLIQRSTAAPLVHFECLARAGTLAEADDKNGVSALTAELLTRGTAKYTADQITDFFDAAGGSLQAGSDRHALTVAGAVLKEDFAAAFDYFAQACLHPTFPADEFTDRKEEQLQAISQRAADTFSEAMEFLADSLPPGCALRRIGGGRKETVGKLTADDCRKFHAAHFVPENLVVTVAGDVDPAQALELVKAQFGGLKPAPVPPAVVGTGFQLDRPAQAHKTTARPDAAVIVLAFPGTDLKALQDNAALLVLKTIVAGTDNGGGWLFHDLRGAGLVYVVGGGNVPAAVPGYFLVRAQTRPDQIGDALKRLNEDLAKARRGEITAEEFERAKQSVINGHARQNETIGERAQQAGQDELLGRGHDFDASFEKRIAAVTLADVKAAAAKYLVNPLTVTTGPTKP